MSEIHLEERTNFSSSIARRYKRISFISLGIFGTWEQFPVKENCRRFLQWVIRMHIWNEIAVLNLQ